MHSLSNQATQSSKLLLNCREAASLLSISPRTLFSLTKDGRLPAVRIGKSVRYRVEDLHAFVQAATNN